jgi:nitrite reductase/ring-hydroxylating ferredoxin subunit
MNHRDPEQLTVPPDGRPEAAQPRWRQDFPIDWPQDEYIARRDFTKFMVLTSLAFFAGHLWILAQSFFGRRKQDFPWREIASVDAIGPGESLVFKHPVAHEPALLVRLDESRFIAFEQKCTHLSCPVIPHVQEGRFHCPCHNASFDLVTGRPLAGPPRRPLPRILLQVREGRVYAGGVEERMT